MDVHTARALRRFLWLAILLCLLILVCPRRVGAAPQSAAPAAPAPSPQNADKASLDADEDRALHDAFRSAEGNPQTLIRQLEEFLVRFPKSPRREQVLGTIFEQAVTTNDPEQAIGAGEQLLEISPDDPNLLLTTTDLLARHPSADGHNQERALQYATRLVAWAEKARNAPPPPGVPEQKWAETQSLMSARAYVARGKLYADTGKNAAARADFEKSYEAYPSPGTAEHLGDVLARLGETERAIDSYATAFAFPEKEADPARREQLRRKLGSLYLAQHPSEAGLGDLILKRYDELTRTLAPRLKSQADSNANLQDPFEFVLERLDGSAIKMADYRGKVLVMEFWATWCLPCRLEGKLLERTWQEFRQEPRAVFLALNVDDDRSSVASFLQEEGWTLPVAYARGIDRLLRVHAIPTLLIFDPTGRVMYRQEGLDAGTFVETVEKKVREALAPTSASALSGRH